MSGTAPRVTTKPCPWPAGCRALAAMLAGALLCGTVWAGTGAGPDPYAASSGTWGQPYPDQWGLSAVNWKFGLAKGSSHEVLVAVIDTGLDYYHPDLSRERLYANPAERLNGVDDDGNGYVDDLMGWNFVDGNGNPWDHAGHGTLVAGIIAAVTGNAEGIAGIAPRARILPLKVLNFIGRGPSSRIAEAIYYAVGKGARIINLSLGGETPSKAILRAVEYAGRRNVLVVAAAGNDGKEVTAPRFFDLPNVITVGASDTKQHRAAFSNFGPALDIVAPGVDILSLRARRTDVAYVAGVRDYRPRQHFVGPDARYSRVNGTSFAAPFVTGAAALLIGRNPALSAVDVKRMLMQSARDIAMPGVDHDTGYGLLDIAAALEAHPSRFIEARVDNIGIEARDERLFVRVSGVARADRFKRAWIEFGRGEAPKTWKRAGQPRVTPADHALLGEIPAEALDASGLWTLRLLVEHDDGGRREAWRAIEID